MSGRSKSRINDFVLRLANVNGTGSASANSLLMKVIFRMGIPVMGKNFFPSNIQGSTDLVRDSNNEGRPFGSFRSCRPHGRDERSDLSEGP